MKSAGLGFFVRDGGRAMIPPQYLFDFGQFFIKRLLDGLACLDFFEYALEATFEKLEQSRDRAVVVTLWRCHLHMCDAPAHCL